MQTVQVELRATGQPVSLVFFGGSNAIHLGIICGVSERWILGPSECPGDLASLLIIFYRFYYHFLASQPPLNVHAAMMPNLIHENHWKSTFEAPCDYCVTLNLPTVTIEESRSIETQAPSKASGRQPVTLASHPSLPAYPMQECHKKFDIFTSGRCGEVLP